MKKIAFLFAFSALCLFASAQKSNRGYVVTNSDTIFCNKIAVGIFKTRCTLADGKKMKIDNKSINQYLMAGVMKKKMPVVMHGKETSKEAMMEYVTLKNGVCVYKYVYYNGAKECEDAIYHYFIKGKCVSTSINPTLNEVASFLAQYKKPEDQAVKGIQLVTK